MKVEYEKPPTYPSGYKGMKKKGQGPPRKPTPSTQSIEPIFEGRVEQIKGFVYDMGYRSQADSFIKMTNEIVEYAVQNCRHGVGTRKTTEKKTDIVTKVYGLPPTE